MSHKISILFEYHTDTLYEDLVTRTAVNNYYSEKELWLIAESLLNALAYLQEKEIAHEDI